MSIRACGSERVRGRNLRRLLKWAGHHFANVITVAALSLRILLIVAGLHGFALTLLVQKPPGPYLFACSIAMIVTLGAVLTKEKRSGPGLIITGMIVATVAQQLIHRLLAPEASRLWLTLQYISLELLMIGAMLRPKREAE